MITNWTIPRESVEWVGPIHVYANAVETSTYMVAVVEEHNRPMVWTAPAPGDVPNTFGVMVGPGTGHVLPPGDYRIWVKVNGVSEQPVLDHVGSLSIT